MRRQTVMCLALSVAMSVGFACRAAPTSPAIPDAEVISEAAIPIDSDSDLDQVIKAIGNARIVMIGEPWHGDGAAIAGPVRHRGTALVGVRRAHALPLLTRQAGA